MLLDKVEHSFAWGRFNLLDLALMKWGQCVPSSLVHHGALCCTLAREWISSADYSYMHGESVLFGPRWIRQRFNWGPSRWPIGWCEALKEKTLDCGAHSALAREVFSSRGLPAYPVQLIQQYSEDTTAHWKSKWTGAEVSPDWILRDLIYHEACAIETAPGRLKIWDPSAATWINPDGPQGFGSLLAWRVTNATPGSQYDAVWGAFPVTWNEWQRVERKQAGGWPRAHPLAPAKETTSIAEFDSVVTVDDVSMNEVAPVA